MIGRVVQIKCKPGMEDQLREIGQRILVPVNRDAGCVDVYFLAPFQGNDPSSFKVVSVWQDLQTLINLKSSEKYQTLLQALALVTESITEEIFTITS